MGVKGRRKGGSRPIWIIAELGKDLVGSEKRVVPEHGRVLSASSGELQRREPDRYLADGPKQHPVDPGAVLFQIDLGVEDGRAPIAGTLGK